ncbi:hypothetical protein ACFYE9_07850 [Rhizobium leguminosarum]|uniref:HEPN domain-containing protein n=2 Tax=Rhizobium leguminosarum TaxID=384 RepID=A0A154IL49_RHILE|nr:hypothetical protein [Rhizobium leguminosarum]KZB01304.1 hypothetical protein A4A59_13790 [Rhizobium leguminosarum]
MRQMLTPSVKARFIERMSITEDQEDALYKAFLSNPDRRLIVPAENGAPSVEFRFGGEWRECRIWEGYLDASLILLRQILEQRGLANNLIFPALFNLRHAVEVALKWHIQYAGGAVSKDAGHSLNALIESFRRTADDLDDEASYISDYMLNRISELAIIDPRSITFRYSTELDGSPIEIAPERWDLHRLIFIVDELSFWLDNLSGKIDLSRDERYQAYLRDG